MKNCTSSNKSVATVTNKGKITAKKNGTTTIKVKLTSGKTLSCKVTVVGNSFKAAKADMLSTVGSTNVDFRSFEHNFEVNAFMYDVETALEMKEIFLQDQRESTQIFLKNWGRRSWRQKAAESIVRLLAPLL